MISLDNSGQPLFNEFPFSSGQRSSLSKIPSESESGHGQPLFNESPAMFGHSSF